MPPANSSRSPAEEIILDQIGHASLRENHTRRVAESSPGRPRPRKRVSRACEACRRRKIKCDGQEECYGCLSASLDCVYQTVAGEKMMKDHLQSFDDRLERLERMFNDFLTNVHSSARPVVSRGRPASPSPSRRRSLDESINTSEAGKRKSNHCETFQSEQNEAEPCRKRRRFELRLNQERTYADPFGELYSDERGEFRYIGLGSTVSLVDMCMPFRKHLHTGLQNKGYDNGGTIFCHPPQAPEKSVTLSLPFDEITFSVNKSRLLDLALVKVLVQWYYETIHLTIPVISKEDFHSQLGVLYAPNTESTKSQFLPIFYGVLAIAALSIPSNNEGLRSGRLGSFDRAHLSSLFFECSVESNHISPCTGRHFSVGPKEPGVGRSLSSVIALVLQSYYLASIGYQAEAWISVGQAIRLGQDIGLHRAAAQLGFQKCDHEKRKYTWWCIYSLDRTLSSTLGRPLAIRDTDCDVELPDVSSDGGGAGFVAIIKLRRILGNILETVAAVQKVKDSRALSQIPELRRMINRLNSDLQNWARDVPANIKNADDRAPNMERLVALSGYFSAIMLLYRYLIPNPHRPSPLTGSEAMHKCARAATNCIRLTTKVLQTLPVCADLIFHAQHVFTASVVLLHCIRRSEDVQFIEDALKEVEVAGQLLKQLQRVWTGAENLACFIEEYLEFILSCLERGLNFKGCAFPHEEHELTGLEWREDSAEKEPGVWPELDFAND